MRFRTYKNTDLDLSDCHGPPQQQDESPFLGSELSAGSLGCGNDLVEALITAQIISARIEADIIAVKQPRD
jgi:hypothetical protein